MKQTQKKVSEAPKVGDWVKTEGKKPRMGVVTGINKYGFGSEIYAVFQDVYGESDGESFQEEELVTMKKAPEYVVVWSTFYNDPVCYFETKAEAEAFRDKILKRRGSEKVVEVRIFKVTK